MKDDDEACCFLEDQLHQSDELYTLVAPSNSDSIETLRKKIDDCRKFSPQKLQCYLDNITVLCLNYVGDESFNLIMIPKVNFLKECIAKITKDFKINVTKLLPELLENLIEYFLLICNDIERIMSGVDNIISVAKLMLETEQKSMIEQLKGARKSLTTVVDKHLLLLIDKQSDLILLPNFDIESQIEVNKFHQNIDWLNEECKVNKKNVCNICCLFYNFCSGHDQSI